jgi:hypothetical protein
MSIPDPIVQDPEPVVIITGQVQTDRLREDQTDRLREDPQPDIVLQTVGNGLLYIPIVREMFISVNSQIVIGNRDKTGAGPR